MTTIDATVTVDDIVSDSISAAKVLSKHGIDFCCEGERTLKEACAEAGISVNRLLREISAEEQIRSAHPADPSSMSADELTHYIEVHHHYITENITFIKANLNRLVRLFAEEYPEVIQIRNTFEDLTGPLMIHMQHEEFIVFPYIRQIAKTGKPVRSSMYRDVDSPIPAMLADHDKGEKYLRRLDELTHHYQAPRGGGNAFKVTYAAMRELEKDLQAHLSLENEVLFPKAVEIESKVYEDSLNHWLSMAGSSHS
jgi:regulator of cell morphogenesis and NO signaling